MLHQNHKFVVVLGSRITSFFNFGYVALSIKSVSIHDVGIYTCRAYNNLGEASTSNELSVISKEDVIYDSQHPEGLKQIQRLEDSRWVLQKSVFSKSDFLALKQIFFSSRYQKKTEKEMKVTQKPRFLGPLKGTNKIVEGQRAHFEARVEPQNDTTLQVSGILNFYKFLRELSK